MIIIIDGEQIDIHDDDKLRAVCLRQASQMVELLQKRKTRKALTDLLADVRFLFLKAQAVLFFHESRSHKFMDVETVKDLVEYMRLIIGEPPATNDSVIVKPPEPEPKVIVP